MLLKIFKLAKINLIIVDNYADENLLDIISKLNVKVTLIAKPGKTLTTNMINKYNKQYSNLKVVFNSSFHDRFIIIDRKEVYHCGTSINHAGKTAFAINKMEEESITKKIVDDIVSVI